jgi:hypothetical protein
VEEVMAKEAAVCPFSRKKCKECAVYFGRHFELCSTSNYHLRETRHAKAKAWNNDVSTNWELPEIPDDSNTMVNIEDFCQAQDL